MKHTKNGNSFGFSKDSARTGSNRVPRKQRKEDLSARDLKQGTRWCSKGQSPEPVASYCSSYYPLRSKHGKPHYGPTEQGVVPERHMSVVKQELHRLLSPRNYLDPVQYIFSTPCSDPIPVQPSMVEKFCKVPPCCLSGSLRQAAERASTMLRGTDKSSVLGEPRAADYEGDEESKKAVRDDHVANQDNGNEEQVLPSTVPTSVPSVPAFAQRTTELNIFSSPRSRKDMRSHSCGSKRWQAHPHSHISVTTSDSLRTRDNRTAEERQLYDQVENDRLKLLGHDARGTNSPISPSVPFSRLGDSCAKKKPDREKINPGRKKDNSNQEGSSRGKTPTIPFPFAASRLNLSYEEDVKALYQQLYVVDPELHPKHFRRACPAAIGSQRKRFPAAVGDHFKKRSGTQVAVLSSNTQKKVVKRNESISSNRVESATAPPPPPRQRVIGHGNREVFTQLSPSIVPRNDDASSEYYVWVRDSMAPLGFSPRKSAVATFNSKESGGHNTIRHPSNTPPCHSRIQKESKASQTVVTNLTEDHNVMRLVTSAELSARGVPAGKPSRVRNASTRSSRRRTSLNASPNISKVLNWT